MAVLRWAGTSGGDSGDWGGYDLADGGDDCGAYCVTDHGCLLRY